MKTITCDRCGRTLKPNEVYRTLSADNFISNLGSVTNLLYCKYATYDLCEECNDLFNHFIANAISDFVHKQVNQDNKPIVEDM